jgi:hypothetical protein
MRNSRTNGSMCFPLVWAPIGTSQSERPARGEVGKGGEEAVALGGGDGGRAGVAGL